MKNAIEIYDINKSYRNKPALKNINLHVEPGEIFGLIGPDGAGKTTLIRILTTLLLADSGTAIVNGSDIVKDYKQIRATVGYMPGRFSLYQDLTVEENMTLFAKIFGTSIAENYSLVADIYSQIEPFKDRQAGQLSGGMKQKLALSCALIHKPDVLFLDEPTTGVDPVSRKELWDMLKKLKNEGITVFVSTAYMDEATLCDRVALIQDGVLLSVNSVDGIIHSFKKKLISVKSDDIYRLIGDLRKLDFVEKAYPFGDCVHTILLDSEADENMILDSLKNHNHINLSAQQVIPTVEDCFIDLMENHNG